ncbi:DEAD/DEAH box helicase [Streptomyces sp. F63]|uniref:DEAD/DEAH box helicase n=1 Tax=Streptomyces sp. F63 TaxID=2824887 RepID=UPI001B376279|nr:DEAD/DEAH box helicase [Streptomyces sp. F63]MBQ0987184.1 DEAD/DEAH box helicase [Streptomyces sp. F63]
MPRPTTSGSAASGNGPGDGSGTGSGRRAPRSRGRRPANTPGNGTRTGGRKAAAPAAPAVSTEPAAPAAPGTPPRPPAATFAELPLNPALLTALTANGVTDPFPIQSATLPDSLAGRDVLGRGRTGSGKTLAFGLPLLSRTAGRRADGKRPLALVLVPTRELATQVTDALTPYATALGLRITTVVGGMSINRQTEALRKGAEVLVATPGRLADLIDRRACSLGDVAVTVLDEADQMTDMGFLPQVTRLMEQVAPDGQRMLFSATLDRNVDKLVRRFLVDPVTHSVDPSAATVTAMEHHVLHVQDTDKKATVTEIAAREGRTIMFVHTKRGADRLTKQLLAAGVRAVALHGGKSQPQRTRTLEQFRTGEATTLIATNVAARGIHIDGLDLVVNVDPPTEAKDYLHRGGRTARAGEAGTVVTLVTPDQRRDMSKLMTEARISPGTARVRPGDPELVRITGARPPSGRAVVIQAPAQPAAPARKRGPRSGGAGRTGGTGGTAGAPYRGRSGEGRSRRRHSGRGGAGGSARPVA